MPKFGIVKKTFFNPKVLIILIVTIIVGTSLFDKKGNKTTIKKGKLNQKKEVINIDLFENVISI